ncbi:LOW QUALITY PROTEIN: peroxisomal and mitochondrial division factor 2-like, partial [Vigna umbellata]|uniref:LOW QUALITY PROTEIN: peroxisomal and mitochondrial division factor 2-like n=1 Tax=Vigna umbellata TaxID=87088 RepID=UPI001F5F672C
IFYISTDYNHILPIIILFHRLNVDLKDVVAAEVIAVRAADLETDVARLQYDLISSEMIASEEARADASELRKDLGEKESLVESLEKELTALKKVKAEGAVRVRDLERKIGVLETKEIEERNKRIRFEEEMRDRVDEKEKEINGFKQKLVELEKVTAEKKSELEELVKQKLKLEEALRESEEKVAAFERA